MMNTKPNLIEFKAALEQLLNQFPEIVITVTNEGEVVATDIEVWDPHTQYWKEQLQVVLTIEAEKL